MQKPYVSICGVRTPDQATGLRHLFARQQYKTHVGALGFVTSTSSLLGEKTHNFLTPDELFPLLEISPAVNIIHHSSSKPENIAQEITQILNYKEIYTSGLCRTIQLNNGLIELRTLAKIKEQHEDLDLVLSIDKKSMANGNLLNEIKQRQQFLTYFLIDPSYGTGTPFNVQDATQIFQQLKAHMPTMIGGFAGGLSPETVAVVTAEIQKTNVQNFSLCVDSGVRGINGCDLDKAKAYLTNVTAALTVPQS